MFPICVKVDFAKQCFVSLKVRRSKFPLREFHDSVTTKTWLQVHPFPNFILYCYRNKQVLAGSIMESKHSRDPKGRKKAQIHQIYLPAQGSGTNEGGALPAAGTDGPLSADTGRLRRLYLLDFFEGKDALSRIFATVQQQCCITATFAQGLLRSPQGALESTLSARYIPCQSPQIGTSYFKICSLLWLDEPLCSSSMCRLNETALSV